MARGELWRYVGRVGVKQEGEDGLFEAQLEVPGLNADSLLVIKNSLS